ncbi:hypothetical protein BaRGS_00010733 [Batillaria attramentaria]|uniref:Uncharacterized protein n=1 Tax=Batillaria attramentaria TaxID=370345 RepID=A0ABD0LFL1_9CAEN
MTPVPPSQLVPPLTPGPTPGPPADTPPPPTPVVRDAIPRALRALMPHNAPGLKEQPATVPADAPAAPPGLRRSTRKTKQFSDTN